MKIAVEGNLAQQGSYGIVNLNLARALAKRGHQVSVIGFDISRALLAELIRGDEELTIGDPAEVQDVRVRQMWPPVWAKIHPEEKLVVIQPWEFGSIPLKWLEGIDGVDAVWVPSEYCKRGYIQSGVSADKVWVVPNGCDIPSLPERTYKNDKTKRLIYVGGTIGRKGVDVLIKAMAMLDDVLLKKLELTVKETGGDSFYRGQSVLDGALQEHPRVNSRVKRIAAHLERNDLLRLMRDSDYLVQPYRAEGFAIPVLEAMALGTPVIHTQGGATNEFLIGNESILIPSTLTVGEPPVVGDMLLADRHYWLEPSTQELAKILTEIAGEDSPPKNMVEAARRSSSSYTWEKVGERAETSINDLIAEESPSDKLSELEKSLLRLIAGEKDNGIKVLSSLVSIGDLDTAALVAEYLEENASPELAGNFSQVLNDITKARKGIADLWSGSPYRAVAVRLGNKRSGKYGYVHEFEGGDAATYAIAAHISGYLTRCNTVLDIGCGQGSMMRALRSAGKKVFGIEVDPGLVAKLHNDGFEVFEGHVPDDMEKYKIPNFDGVFMGHLVEHMQPEDLQRIFNWIYANIDDNGTILIQTPDFSNPRVSQENFWLDSSHIRPYPVPLLKAMLTRSGFYSIEGGCRRIPEVAPLDVIVLARKVAADASRTDRASIRSHKKTVAHYALGDASGFANASRRLLNHATLSAAGWEKFDVVVNPEANWPISSRSLDIETAKYREFDVAVVDVPLGWVDRVVSQIRAKHKIVRTTFEAWPLPAQLRRTLLQFEEIWTFSNFDAQIFAESGLDKGKIHVIPPSIEGYDENEIRARRRATESRPPQLLSVFNFEPRKNPATLLKAFAICAGKDEGLSLTLKTSGVEVKNFVDWMQAVLTKEEFEEIQFKLTLIPQRLNDEQLQTLYLSHDIFVLPTRGEGFGLPFIEAMSYGLVVVCPDIGGHRDVCDESNSVIVPTSLAPVLAESGAEPFIGCYWRDVDANDLANKILEVASNQEQRAALRINALARVGTWNKAISTATERITGGLFDAGSGRG